MGIKNKSPIGRRIAITFYEIFFLAFTFSLFPPESLKAQGTGSNPDSAAPAPTIKLRSDEVRADRMLAEYFKTWTGKLEETHKKELASLKSASDWQARRERVREYLEKTLGPPPRGGTLVSSLVTGRVQGSGYRIEKLLLESTPHFYITANLYIPDTQAPPEGYPAVIMHPGPYDNGKETRKNSFRNECACLASSGFAVLTYDPIGQGERQQYHDPVTGGIDWRPRPPAWRIYQSEKFDPEIQDVPGTGVLEQSMIAMLGLLVNRPFIQKHIFDVVTLVDHLNSRKDINSASIFQVAGGMNSKEMALCWALDDRIKGLHLGMFRHSFFDRLKATRPPGPSTALPSSLASGIGIREILSLGAPRTLWVMGAQSEKMESLKNLYTLIGAEKNIKTEWIIPGKEPVNLKWSLVNDWLSEQTGIESGIPTAPADSFPPGSLEATETGQVVTSLVARTLPQIYAEKMEKHAAGLRGKAIQAARDKITTMKGRLGLDKIISPPAADMLGTNREWGLKVERIVLHVEEGISLPVDIFLPSTRKGKHPAVIYIGDNSQEYNVDYQGYCEVLARQGYLALILAPRGWGRTAPSANDWDADREFFAHLLGSQAQAAYTALELGTSMIELRIRDIAAAARYLASRNDVDRTKIACRGYGELATLALYSAASIPEISTVIYERGPVSFADMVSQGVTFFRPEAILPGGALDLDISAAAAALAPRGIFLLNTVDARKVRLSQERVKAAFTLAVGEYRSQGRPDGLKVMLADTPAERRRAVLDWLESEF